MSKRRRRGTGEGSIFQRQDGQWVARFVVGYGPDGKRRRKTLYGRTKAEVQDKLYELQHQVRSGLVTDADNMTVGEWLDHWFETIAKRSLRKTTARGYAGVIRNYLKPMIGRVKLTKLSPVNVQAMLDALPDKMAESTRGKVFSVLRRSLKIAFRQGLVYRNVCDVVEPPKQRRDLEMQTLTADEAVTLIAESQGTRYHALIVLAITTGMRQGELFGLKWSDIDLKAGTLSVVRALIELPNGYEFGPPKSRKGRRKMTLPAMAIAALQDHQREMFAEGRAAADDLVFTAPQGGPVHKRNFYQRYYKPLLKAAGAPDIRFHDLRHTSATLMLAGGVHAKILQQRLGHSQISLTLDTYSHVLPEMDEAAAGTFDRALGGA